MSNRRQRRTLWAGSVLIAGGAAALGLYFWTLHEQAAKQERAKVWLSHTAATPLSVAPPPIRHGDTIGELDIPRLQLSVMVFEGDDAGILRIGAGRIPGTALPNGRGNIGIAAHRDTWFRPLRFIRANDVIVLKTPAGASEYTVTESKIVDPTAVEVLAPAPGRDLTLVTCYPFYYVGKAPQRFIVHARKSE